MSLKILVQDSVLLNRSESNIWTQSGAVGLLQSEQFQRLAPETPLKKLTFEEDEIYDFVPLVFLFEVDWALPFYQHNNLFLATLVALHFTHVSEWVGDSFD